MAFLATNTYSKGHDDSSLGISGFKDELIRDGQGADVYKHIYGHAGAIMIGSASAKFFGMTGQQWSDKQLKEDIDQRDHPDNYPHHSAAEAATEVRDTNAGRLIGSLMGRGIKGQISSDDLRKQIFDILCDH